MATIGEELRCERVRRELTFKDVEQELHIRAAYLEAIEEGNFKVIPGHVYTKGFIRNYGNFLGLDGQRLVLNYKDLIGEDRAFVVRTSRNRHKRTLKTEIQEEQQSQHTKRLSFESRQKRRRKTLAQERMIVGILAVFIVLFLIWLFFL